MAASTYTGDEDGGLLTDINVTPLVDVVLVLLIVFMITVPAIVGLAPIKVELPQTSAVAPADVRLPLAFTLQVGDDGRQILFLADQPVDDATLRAMLQAEAYQPLSAQTASLAADRDIPYGEVVAVLDKLTSLGLSKISLDTQHVAE